MIIANVGSMGTGKTSTILNLYCYIYLKMTGMKRNLYTAFYDQSHLKKNTLYDELYDGPQVSSRIHKGEKAELITVDTSFESIKTPSDIVFIDEFQFIGEEQFQILKEKDKIGSLIYLSVLNRSFSDYIWPQTRKICTEADFIYVLENNNTTPNLDTKTNCMMIDGKFDLIYREDPSRGFTGCSYDYWFKETSNYLSSQLNDNEGKVYEMIKKEPSLLQPLLRLFDLWKMRKTN